MTTESIFRAPLYVALIHSPIYNRRKEVSVSAITNYDIHDISRMSRCFGVSRFFIVHPMESQRALAQKILSHWTEGFGASFNPKRMEALSLGDVVSTLEEAKERIALENDGQEPLTLVTKARSFPEDLSYLGARNLLLTGERPLLILFGTGWGLTDEFIESMDFKLAPLRPTADFKHFSVRSAASIVLDRIIGDDLLPLPKGTHSR
jgi:hypothetical protein